jgi:hypothetical protein
MGGGARGQQGDEVLLGHGRSSACVMADVVRGCGTSVTRAGAGQKSRSGGRLA